MPPSTVAFFDGPPPRERGGFTENATLLAGQAGLLFGWRPDDFWNATPAELAALVSATMGGEQPAPLLADSLATLIERFPDE